ncbi:MAG: phosphate ABC transporter substrate-binding protein [Planctomycetes bacterium]|nr:phosphate ABC transporter substrate-binding protein [Planctomycetota bacterium]
MRLLTIFGAFGAAAVAAVSLFASQSAGKSNGSVTNSNLNDKSSPKATVVAAARDDEIKKYETVSGISGNLNSVGSDTLLNLMTHWGEGFQGLYPSARVQVEGKGSGTAPPALIKGASQLGPMSREMKDSELDEFEKKFGYKPTPIKVAIDALAVYVNKDNPIDKLTLTQVDAIFSKTRKGGAPEDINSWGQLGLKGDWAEKPISIYGRNSASGTNVYFKEHALAKGDYKDSVKEQPGSGGVIQAITADAAGIGYSGIGYKTAGVKTLDVAAKDGKPYFSTDAKNVYDGKYPLSRFLYVYINKEPNKPVDPLVREMLKYILSKQGQEQVDKDEFLKLTPKMVNEELQKLGGN